MRTLHLLVAAATFFSAKDVHASWNIAALFQTSTNPLPTSQAATNLVAHDKKTLKKKACVNGTELNGVCVCDNSFIGESCDQKRCPGDCTQRGKCTDGECACEPGFHGDACEMVDETSPYSSLAPIKAAAKASPDMRIDVGKIVAKIKAAPIRECPDNCSGNGKCNTDGSCTCFTGYSGPSCSDLCPNFCTGRGQCLNGACLCFASWGGIDCSVKICCSGHGDCTIPDVCVCDAGWSGPQCSVPMSCPDPTCSGHGKCEHGKCDCEGGFSGVLCEQGPQECPKCPKGGTCDRSTGKCMCGAGPCKENIFPMAAKEKAAKKKQQEDKAAGAGMGDLTRPEAKKAAAAGGPAPPAEALSKDPNCNNGKYNKEIKVCECDESWHGKYCDKKRCAGFDEENGTDDCNGNGICLEGSCHCLTGWGAAACDTKVCAMDCGAHGKCTDGTCVCEEGWKGPACREPSCGVDSLCSGHGTCTFRSSNSPGECICEHGFTGAHCQMPVFAALGCPNECSGNGLCVDGKCVCGEGFFGGDCSTRSCGEGKLGPNCDMEACPRDCTGHGLCMAGECSCWKDYSGVDCSIPVQCMNACREQCLDPETERCEFCKGQCLTLDKNPVIGRHNPFQDLANLSQQKTVVKRIDPVRIEDRVTEVEGVDASDLVLE